jgi:hypothetical protein
VLGPGPSVVRCGCGWPCGRTAVERQSRCLPLSRVALRRLGRSQSAATLTNRSGEGASYCALSARGESLASHGDGRGAPPARRDDREYRESLSEEQRRRRGCIACRMQPDFHHGLLWATSSKHGPRGPEAVVGEWRPIATDE